MAAETGQNAIFIGEWVATLVGLWPLILLAVLIDMDSAYGVFWWLAPSGIALAPWLILLQRWQGVRINVPYLPIKWLWLTTFLIIIGRRLLGWMEQRPSAAATSTTLPWRRPKLRLELSHQC